MGNVIFLLPSVKGSFFLSRVSFLTNGNHSGDGNAAMRINFLDLYTIGGYSINIKKREVIVLDKFLHDHPSKPRTKDEKQAIINRLKRIEGQVRGIQKMVEEDRYCVDILVQISAIQAALKNVGFSVTERHMKHCVSDAISKGEGTEMIDELMSVMKQFSK